MSKNFKVFISYSYDSAEHMQWISDFVAKLQRNGVNIIFHQQEPIQDQEMIQSIESGIRDSDRVLVICTDSYVRKANEGEVGVGYEPTILTKQIVQNLRTNKFIPLIRQTLAEDKTPEFLKERAYVDFTDDTQFDAKFEVLLYDRLLLPPLQIPLIPYIESLHVKNYRALRDIKLKHLKPLSVFLGPNGSGKSTLFDVFVFLAECFTDGLRRALDKREGFKELRTRGCDGPIEFELKYREKPKTPIITYHLSINEDAEGPFVETEWLQWRRGSRGKPVRFLNFCQGRGTIIGGETPEDADKRINEQFDDPSVLAVSTLGQLARHPRVSAFRRFITDWYLSDLSTEATRQATNDGPQKRLSTTGDNLPNVIQYLQERYPERLEKIISSLSNQVPRLEKVDTELMMSGRRLLKIKDAPFDQPISAKYASDGTLKLLSYLTLFHDPKPPQLIGIEEPENYLHPRLLTGLVGEFLEVLMFSQLIITTHSPRLVNELRAEEVWVLYRDEEGFAVCKRASEMLGIKEFMENEAKLGELWMEGYFEFGYPLTNAGGPKRGRHA